MTTAARLCLVMVCSLIAVNASADDWPQFRGPGGMGVSRDTGVPVRWGPRENIVWKVELPGAGTSSPVVVGRHIFLTCYRRKAGPDSLQRFVVCLDRASGDVRWTKDVESSLPEQDRIREDHGYASSTPAADGEGVYAFFGKSGVVALDHGGKPRWRADVGGGLNGWGSGASPVLFGDLVLVNASVESESLVALDRATGKEVWRAKGVRESWSTPLLVPGAGGKTELVVPAFRKLLGMDPATGKQLWWCDTGIDWYMVPSLVAADGVVYCIGGRSGGALAVRAGGTGDVTKTHRVWVGRKGSNVSSPILHAGHLYWMNDNTGVAYCAEAKTGTVLYEERVDARAGQVYASPVLADGRLYYLARTGQTYVLAAAPKYERLAVNDLGERGMFNASPAVADGRLLIRSDRYLYCIGTK